MALAPVAWAADNSAAISSQDGSVNIILAKQANDTAAIQEPWCNTMHIFCQYGLW